jgi:hypothetical protein
MSEPNYRMTTIGEILANVGDPLVRAVAEDDPTRPIYFAERPCAYFAGNTVLTAEQWSSLEEQICSVSVQKKHSENYSSSYRGLLVVNGDLDVTGGLGGLGTDGCERPFPCVVIGDLVCDWYITESFCDDSTVGDIITGKVVARHFAAFYGTDDECTHGAATPCDLITPQAFFWNHEWRDIGISRETPKHIVLNGSIDFEPEDLDLDRTDQLIYAYCDWAIQGDEFAVNPEVWTHKVPGTGWDLTEIATRAARGETFFADGFDPRCLPLIRKAEQEGTKESFSAARAAIDLAPGYFPAWFLAGKALTDAGAFDQARPYLERALELLPDAKNNTTHAYIGLFQADELSLEDLLDKIEEESAEPQTVDWCVEPPSRTTP